MKPLNFSELQIVVEKLQALTGARLQEVKSGSHWYELNFYHERDMHPVLIDVQPRSPLVLPLPAPKKWSSKRTPVALFLNAHVRDHRLREVRLAPGRGRVLEFIFDNHAVIEVRLFPHGQNVLVSSGDKKISHAKVLPEPPAKDFGEQVSRTLDEICTEFLRQFSEVQSESSSRPVEASFEKAIQKKILARDKMRADIESKKQSPLREVGAWLKEHQTLNVPEEWQDYVDLRLSFAENLQNVFAAAKELSKKIARAEERLAMLEAEIASPTQAIQAPGASKNTKTAHSLLHSAGVKGRTFDLSTGHRLFVGRSGADNLRILRAASAWDYWLHLKDEPGSHAILRRQKNEKISDAVLLESLQHLVRTTYGDKAARHEGEKFLGLVVECRYVKPIKGDRLGRVSYQNERVISFTF